MTLKDNKCFDNQCVCNGSGTLIWVVDYHRWKYQLLCNKGGLIFLEVDDDIEVYDYSGDKFGLRGNPPRDSPPLPTIDDYIRCEKCNRLILRMGHHQKYCFTCAKIAHNIRKREWIRKRRATLRIANG